MVEGGDWNFDRCLLSTMSTSLQGADILVASGRCAYCIASTCRCAQRVSLYSLVHSTLQFTRWLTPFTSQRVLGLHGRSDLQILSRIRGAAGARSLWNIAPWSPSVMEHLPLRGLHGLPASLKTKAAFEGKPLSPPN